MACWTQLNLDEKTEIKTEALSSSFFHLIRNHDHAGNSFILWKYSVIIIV